MALHTADPSRVGPRMSAAREKRALLLPTGPGATVLASLDGATGRSRAVTMSEPSVTTLYRRYGPLIFIRCRRLLRNDAAAEDATQEVFLRVLRHIERAPEDDEALRWIYRISTNYCLNLLRDRKQEVPLESAPEEPVPDAEAQVLDRDLVLRALAAVPASLRAAAVLHYVDGMEQAKVAATLGVSRRTVNYRLAEFLERTRKWAAQRGPR